MLILISNNPSTTYDLVYSIFFHTTKLPTHIWSLTSFLTVVVWRIKLGIIIWELNTSNYKVILLIRSVCPQYQPVHAVVFALWPVKIYIQVIQTFKKKIWSIFQVMFWCLSGCSRSPLTLSHLAATGQWGWATPGHESWPGRRGKGCSSSRSCTPHWSLFPLQHHQTQLQVTCNSNTKLCYNDCSWQVWMGDIGGGDIKVTLPSQVLILLHYHYH